MTIRHHPTDELLAAFAAGTLDQGQHVAIATHLVKCSHCRAWTRSMEQVGGATLAGLSPTAMSSGALAHVETKLGELPRAAEASLVPRPVSLAEVPGLPAFVHRFPVGSWNWIAPRVRLRPIKLPYGDKTRVFLLKSGPGTKMLEHTHTGIEMTCVLSGGFAHEGGHFGPGDFDLGDQTMDHRVLVDPGEDCVCLVAMQGDLRLNGILGRLVQPFIRM
jgi:putative transcriptional regulator